MTKLHDYRTALRNLADWTPYLLEHSGLPGPRGNLELAQAVAELANPRQVEAFLKIPAAEAPENSAHVFVVFCGITALGRSIARGDRSHFPRLHSYACDVRWRVREAVAIALQYVGDEDMPALLNEMQAWSTGTWYERRAVAAALAEPRLLKDPSSAGQVLRVFDQITEAMASTDYRRGESYRVLRQSMGYCWSVAVAALPIAGKPAMEKWLASADPDVRWVMKENLKKNRLSKLDPKWVKSCQRKLERQR